MNTKCDQNTTHLRSHSLRVEQIYKIIQDVSTIQTKLNDDVKDFGVKINKIETVLL